jgi:hypothetical protein
MRLSCAIPVLLLLLFSFSGVPSPYLSLCVANTVVQSNMQALVARASSPWGWGRHVAVARSLQAQRLQACGHYAQLSSVADPASAAAGGSADGRPPEIKHRFSLKLITDDPTAQAAALQDGCTVVHLIRHAVRMRPMCMENKSIHCVGPLSACESTCVPVLRHEFALSALNPGAEIYPMCRHLFKKAC